MTGLAAFLDLRQAASETRVGDGGLDLCAALTDALEAAVVELAGAAPSASTVAVCALGGFGRREQCLQSDVDLMVLHGGGPAVDATAAAVFRPLWDAGLRVGHSVRTPAEAEEAARDRLETLTTLLSARLIAGDDGLFADMMRRLTDVVAGKPLAPALAAAERERRTRHPYPVMAANVKDGRGALRTLHGLQWERRRATLLGLTGPAATEAESAALAALLTIRNALHAVTRRPHDVFSPELRQPVARWVGRHPRVVAAMLTRALATGDQIVADTWPDALIDADPLRTFRSRLATRIRSRFGSAAQTPGTSPLGIALDAVARPGPVAFSDDDRAAISAAPPAWTAADRSAFVRLIAAGHRGRAAFDLLERMGWVDMAMPEWAIVRAAPQLAPFHDHPVDSHLWRTVDEMRAIVEGTDPWLTAVAEEVGSTEELYLAAFLHDIGKGRGSDHSKAGAAVAATFLRRAGFGPATSAAVVHAVRHHLLLANLAFRRDIGRPETIDDAVDTLGTLRRLQVLYLLTVADLRATGTAMWNDWKATLLRNLFVACAARLGGDAPATPPGQLDISSFVAAAARHEPRLVEEHLAALPAEYRLVFDPETVAWHLDLVARRNGGIVLGTRPAELATEAVVVAPDQPGLLAAVAATFAAHGIDVLEAHLFTREDAVAIDRFLVRRDRTGDVVSDDVWERVRRDLEAVLRGELDVRGRVAERARAYAGESAAAVPVEITVGEDPATRATTVTVRCSDRVGRFAQIMDVLHEQECDVQHAKLDVRGRQVVDTFLVRRNGHPLRGHADRKELAAAIAATLET